MKLTTETTLASRAYCSGVCGDMGGDCKTIIMPEMINRYTINPLIIPER